MTSHTEKRVYHRINHEVTIIYSPNISQNDYRGGEMLNFSAGGMCFESSNPVSPEADIYIIWTDQMDLPKGLFTKTAENADDFHGYKACNGEVVWCRKTPENDIPFYNVGIKFKEIDVRLPDDD